MVPRKVGAAWEILAPAKLNLYLEVLGRRTDGFHELETLMVPLKFYDQLSWTPGPTSENPVVCQLSIVGPACCDELLSAGDQNLVLQAARLMAARAGIKPHGRFILNKRIPLQAGMGGGSSDAAATLMLVNEAWQIGASHQQLSQVAAELGSDVPFFLNAGPAICRGRGEVVEAVSGLPQLHFVIVKPEFGLSTQRVFSKLREIWPCCQVSPDDSSHALDRLVEALRRGAIGQACRWMTNRLELAVAELSQEIQMIKDTLSRAGCRGQLMTGSGSAVVAIARSAWHARRITKRLATQNLGIVLAAASG